MLKMQAQVAQNVLTHEFSAGDLARWLPNGMIDFMGRLDNQARSCCAVGRLCALCLQTCLSKQAPCTSA